MLLKFTEHPVYISANVYAEAIKYMSGKLMKTDLVKCVYQVGGVSSPGISDLDLYAVFKNEAQYFDNPVQNLSSPYDYLFSHKLFGTSEQLAPEMEKFTFFGKYNLIAGEAVNMFSHNHSQNEEQLLKSQIALEYLVKAYIAVSIAIYFRTIKLRSFLLHAKAVQYDLEFLEIKNNKLESLVFEIINLRNNWFNITFNENNFSNIVFQYRDALAFYISECVNMYNFYLTTEANRKIAKKITLINSQYVEVKRNGFALPPLLISNSDFLFKVNNRLNAFKVTLPITDNNIPSILMQRHLAIRNAFIYNKNNLPWFIATGHGLNIFNN